MTTRILPLVQILILILTLSAPLPAQAAKFVAAKLVGTWQLTITPDPATGIPPLVNLASIGRNGQLVNVVPALGTGVGQLNRQSLRNYDANFFGFMNMNGQLLRYEVDGALEVPPDGTVRGTFTTTTEDLFGNPYLTYGGTLSSVRLTD